MVMDSSVVSRKELFSALEDFCNSVPQEKTNSSAWTERFGKSCDSVLSEEVDEWQMRRVEIQMLRAANCTKSGAMEASYDYYLLMLSAGAKALHAARQGE